MDQPSKEEIIALAEALIEVGDPDSDFGTKGLKFMCRQAAKLIRRMRPDLAFGLADHTTDKGASQ